MAIFGYFLHYCKFIGYLLLISGGKRRRVRLPIEDQLEIVRRFEAGEKAGRIATDTGMKDSSVRAIIKRKEELKKLEQINETFGTSPHLVQKRSPTMETMERLLIGWIEHCNQQKIPIDMTTIQAQARDFYQKVKNEQDFSEMTPKEQRETFVASKGWYFNFKKRTGVIPHIGSGNTVHRPSANEQSGDASRDFSAGNSRESFGVTPEPDQIFLPLPDSFAHHNE